MQPPDLASSRIEASIAGMYSEGITPPFILLTNASTGAPLGWASGSRSMVTLA